MENRDKQLLIDKLKSIVKSFVQVVKDKTYKDLDSIIEQLKELANQVLPPLKGFIRRNPSKPNTGKQGKFTSAQVPLKKTTLPPVNKAFKQEAIKKRLAEYKAAKKVGYNSEKGSGNPALNEIFNTGVNNPATRKTAQKSKIQIKKTIVPGNEPPPRVRREPQLKLTGDKRRVISSTRSAGYLGNASVTLRTKKQQEVRKHALNSSYVNKLKNDYTTSEPHSRARKLLEAELTKILIESLKTAKSNNATPEEKEKVKETIEELKGTGLLNVSSLTPREKRKLHGKIANNLKLVNL